MLTTVAAILADAPPGMPIRELRLLLGAVLKQSAVWLLTHGDATVGIEQCLELGNLVDRRLDGVPIAYLLGYREFYGREFVVSPAVLIPRPETEMLVDLVMASVGDGGTPSLLDLGTGSGCVAISVALECSHLCVTAIDVSTDALTVAATNAAGLKANVELLHSDWFSAVAGRRFDIIVSNPPYIAEGDLHLAQGDLRFEPATALSSGGDGLTALRRIIRDSPNHLRPNGILALEHGYDQAAAVRELLLTAGFTAVTQHKDIAGITRVSCGVLP